MCPDKKLAATRSKPSDTSQKRYSELDSSRGRTSDLDSSRDGALSEWGDSDTGVGDWKTKSMVLKAENLKVLATTLLQTSFPFIFHRRLF